MGNRRNSPAAQTTSVSDPFSVTHKMLRPQRGYFKNNPNIKIRLLKFCRFILCKKLENLVAVVFEFAVEFGFDFKPLGASPIVRYRKWIRNGCV
ncbi:hypothetical protein ACO0LO_11750 [Undibacterium sp. TJN25]|uniref:hypothetical protein n=1 Tax=Undibacterium sp. TJN25 TaxID=3413056 RepID=UPI003BF1504C